MRGAGQIGHRGVSSTPTRSVDALTGQASVTAASASPCWPAAKRRDSPTNCARPLDNRRAARRQCQGQFRGQLALATPHTIPNASRPLQLIAAVDGCAHIPLGAGHACWSPTRRRAHTNMHACRPKVMSALAVLGAGALFRPYFLRSVARGSRVKLLQRGPVLRRYQNQCPGDTQAQRRPDPTGRRRPRWAKMSKLSTDPR